MSYRFFTKTSSLFAASMMMAGSMFGQGVIWGAGSSDSRIDSIGRFASADGTLTSLGWTTMGVYCTNLNGQPNNPAAWTRDSSCRTAVWTHSANGRGQGWSSGSANTGAMQSPSVADGIAIFDTDYLDNNGQVSGTTPLFNTGAAPNGYNTAAGGVRQGVEGYLQSPAIDLTGFVGQPLVVEMNSRLRWLGGYITMFRRLSVSIDGGMTWANFDVNGTTTTAQPANNVEVIDISSAVSTAAFAANTNSSPTAVHIRFHMAGGYYYWMIDDVKIKRKPDYDLAIAPLGAGNTLGDDFTVYRVSNNRFQPISQIDSTEYQFGAKVVNKGAAAIPASANPRLNISIAETSSGAVVHTQSIPFGQAIGADSTFTVTDQLTWLPDSTLSYNVSYAVQHDSTDGLALNDSSFATFEITDNYYSKCRRDATDGYPFGARTIFPAAGAGNLVSEFEYGSMFYFPKGATASLDSVGFRVNWGATTLGSVSSFPVNVRVYRFEDLNGDGQLDATGLNNPEITLLGVGVDTVNRVTGYTIGNAPILNTNTGLFGLTLNDTSVYLVSLAVSRAQGLETAQDSLYTPFFGADILNYGINASVNDAVPSPVRVGEITTAGAPASNDWNWVGFGADLQPNIGLFITDLSINVENVATADVRNFNVYPNPTREVLNVQVDLSAVSASVSYIMSDASGRVVRMMTNKNVQSEIATFDVANLPAGVYFISIKTAQGFSTQKFVKE